MVDLATVNRYIDALYTLKRSEPWPACEALAALCDSQSTIEEYLTPIARRPLDRLTSFERRWRELAERTAA